MIVQSFDILPPSETVGVKTENPRKFIINFKVVHNVDSDNFYFDQNTVQLNLKNCVKSQKIIKFVSLDNFGGSRRDNGEIYNKNISCLKYHF